MSLGLTTFDAPGLDANAMQKALLERHHVLVQSMARNPRTSHLPGVRVSPNVYTSIAELDRFATALADVVAECESPRVCVRVVASWATWTTPRC